MVIETVQNFGALQRALKFCTALSLSATCAKVGEVRLPDVPPDQGGGSKRKNGREGDKCYSSVLLHRTRFRFVFVNAFRSCRIFQSLNAELLPVALPSRAK